MRSANGIGSAAASGASSSPAGRAAAASTTAGASRTGVSAGTTIAARAPHNVEQERGGKGEPVAAQPSLEHGVVIAARSDVPA